MKMDGTMLPLPPYAFMACTGTTLTHIVVAMVNFNVKLIMYKEAFLFAYIIMFYT
jgi:hypothetical protein